MRLEGTHFDSLITLTYENMCSVVVTKKHGKNKRRQISLLLFWQFSSLGRKYELNKAD